MPTGTRVRHCSRPVHDRVARLCWVGRGVLAGLVWVARLAALPFPWPPLRPRASLDAAPSGAEAILNIVQALLDHNSAQACRHHAAADQWNRNWRRNTGRRHLSSCTKSDRDNAANNRSSTKDHLADTKRDFPRFLPSRIRFVLRIVPDLGVPVQAKRTMGLFVVNCLKKRRRDLVAAPAASTIIARQPCRRGHRRAPNSNRIGIPAQP